MKPITHLYQALALVFVPAALVAGDSPDPVKTIPIDKNEKIILKGQNPASSQSGKASFVIDTRNIRFLFLKMASAKRTAVVFDGAATPGRVCPYFSLSGRNYKVTETEPDIFRIDTPASDAEMKTVELHGCVITSVPDLNRVHYLPR